MAANNVGGGLTVNAGSVNITGGTTTFGSGTSTVGYLTGSGNLTMTGGSLAMGGELRVGGSDQSGSQYIATGAVTVANATLSVGSLTVARGNYLDNSISGTVTLNSGSTLISTNDVILEFAGTGRGKLALNGGNFIVGPTADQMVDDRLLGHRRGRIGHHQRQSFPGERHVHQDVPRQQQHGGQRGQSGWRRRSHFTATPA